MYWLLKDEQEFTSPRGVNRTSIGTRTDVIYPESDVWKDKGGHEGAVRAGKRRWPTRNRGISRSQEEKGGGEDQIITVMTVGKRAAFLCGRVAFLSGIYVSLCVCIHMCLCLSVCLCECACLYLCLCACKALCVRVCLSLSLCVCVYSVRDVVALVKL